jgi:ferritin-like metal-binding protein YciE
VIRTIRAPCPDEVQDLYDADEQLMKALPKMAQAASSGDLRAAIEGHLTETVGHASLAG